LLQVYALVAYQFQRACALLICLCYPELFNWNRPESIARLAVRSCRLRRSALMARCRASSATGDPPNAANHQSFPTPAHRTEWQRHATCFRTTGSVANPGTVSQTPGDIIRLWKLETHMLPV